MQNRVIDIDGIEQFVDIVPEFFDKAPIMPEEFEHLAKIAKAFWLHSGDPKNPHAELTSGKCSNGFIDTLRLLRFSSICQSLADALARRIDSHDLMGENIPDWVIGSDHAGAVFSQNVAQYWSAQHDFTEKGEAKSQNWRRFTIEPPEYVLQVEELMTTSGTLAEVTIRRGGQICVSSNGA
jgi:orotate phosphoribosyltransferase